MIDILKRKWNDLKETVQNYANTKIWFRCLEFYGILIILLIIASLKFFCKSSQFIILVSYSSIFLIVGSIITYILNVLIPTYKKNINSKKYITIRHILYMSHPWILHKDNLIDKFIKGKSKSSIFWDLLSNSSVACSPIAFLSKNVNLLGGFLLILTIIDFIHIFYKNIRKIYISRESYKKLRKQKIHKAEFHKIVIYAVVIFVLFWVFYKDKL